MLQDCTKVKQYTILRRDQVVEKQSSASDSDRQLGNYGSDVSGKGKEVVLKLIDDLERVEVNTQIQHVADNQGLVYRKRYFFIE